MGLLERQAPLQFGRPRLSYRRILVPLVDTQESEFAMALACRLAEDKGAGLTAVTVIEVPVELPLDAHMRDEEAHSRHVLEHARAIGDLYGVKVAPRVLRARAAGEAIVAEVLRADTEMVVLRAPRHELPRRGLHAFGKTVEYVLKHAPCRVMVAALPAGPC
jgi:nucleotide-binding universal stress UspA family protein